MATVRARTRCDLFVLSQTSFSRILHDNPQFAEAITRIARERYQALVEPSQLVNSRH